MERDGDRAGHLDRRPAHLAVALGEVEVADGEERARHVDRQIEPAARDELADVEVAAGLPRRDRPQSCGGGRWDRALRCGSATGPPRSAIRSSRRRRLETLCEGATPTTPANISSGTATPGTPAERAKPPAISQVTRYGSVKTSARKPKPGITAVTPKAAERYSRNSTSRTSPGFAPSTSTGPVSGWARPRSRLRAVRVDALARDQAGHAVLALERQRRARLDRDDGRDLGVPAVVHQISSDTLAAAFRAGCRLPVGPHPRCAQLVQRDDRHEPVAGEDRCDDLGGQSAVRLQHRVERRLVEGSPAVRLDDLPALLQLAYDGLGAQVDRVLVAERRRARRERLVRDRERIVARAGPVAASRGWRPCRRAVLPGWRRSPSRSPA